MNRYQTFHETLIPLLVQCIGARSYLEFGTHFNETFSKVICGNRYGVDISAKPPAQFKMTTAEFIQKKAKHYAPFDFVFIDADHSKEAVKRDFEGIWPYVSKDGLVCLHDTNPETRADAIPGFCGDAWKFARAATVDYESVTLPYHPGLTIIRKRAKWGPK